MAKQIVFTYEDKEYTLEFTRRTVKQMEDEGFVAQDIDRKPNIFACLRLNIQCLFRN